MLYADYAATTPVDPRVAQKMMDCLTEQFYNPSSLYPQARGVRNAVEEARAQILALLEAEEGSILFTSGGTEADNLALLGTALHPDNHKRHLITTAIEHHAVLETCAFLERQGFRITYLPVDRWGRISLQDLESAITEDTFLVSVMWVNNELGTIQDIPAIGRIAHEHGLLFHTDAVQAMTSQPVTVKDVDLLTLSSHKIYGPKGTGALYVGPKVLLTSQIHGGQQEQHLRGGTENVPGIVGFGEAARLLREERSALVREVKECKSLLLNVLSGLEGVQVNSPLGVTADTVLHFSVRNAQAEGLLLRLAMAGVMASMGSACNTQSVEPSHVVKALNIPPEYAQGCIRLSFGKGFSREQAEELGQVLLKICKTS